ncbi:MAG: hypothetical protein AAB893_03305 [Patescibacteria group bacterium]
MSDPVLNFTPLNFSDTKKKTSVPHKEAEPLVAISHEAHPQSESAIEEKVEMEVPSESEDIVEVTPEKPKIDEELEENGVQAVSTLSFFVKNKKIDLPISAEEIEKGLHKPLSSGWRWVAELAEYILNKFHMTIKKVAGVFQVVEKT